MSHTTNKNKISKERRRNQRATSFVKSRSLPNHNFVKQQKYSRIFQSFLVVFIKELYKILDSNLKQNIMKLIILEAFVSEQTVNMVFIYRKERLIFHIHSYFYFTEYSNDSL